MSSPNQDGQSADQVALELLKQIITLSVGVSAFTATFVEQIGDVPEWSLWLLVTAWSGFLVAIVAALRSISAIVKGKLNPDFDWSSGAGRTYAKAAQWGFGVALILLLIFASLGLFHSA